MKCAIIVTGKTKDKVIQKKRGRKEIGLVTIFHVTGIMTILSQARGVSSGEAEEFSEIKG